MLSAEIGGGGGGAIIAVLYAVLVAYGAWVFSMPKNAENWKYYFNAEGWLRGVCFFGAGTWLRSNAEKAVALKVPYGISIPALLAGWLCLTCKDPVVTYAAIPLAVAGLWYTMRGVSLPGWLTAFAFPLYVMHAFFGVACNAAKVALPQDWLATHKNIIWMATFAVMLFGSIAAAHLLRRLSPRFSAVAFGGR